MVIGEPHYICKGLMLFLRVSCDCQMCAVGTPWGNFIMNRFNLIVVYVSIFLSFITPSFLFAEEIKTYDELVITAFRTPSQLDAIGSAYSVITAEDIENRQALTVSDLLRTIPGVEVDRSGPVGTQTALRIRGGESNHTLVVIDGVVVNDESQGSIYNFADLLTTDIERIEVIRGAQSALWGSEAISGVINIITKKGSGDTNVTANLEGGSFNTTKAGGSVSGGTDRYDYRLSASKFNTEGTDIDLSSDKDGYENSRLSLNGSYRPTDKVEINASVNHTNSTTEFDNCNLVFAATDMCESENDFTYASMQAIHNSFDYRFQNSLKTTFKYIDHENFADNSKTSAQSSTEYNVTLQSSMFFETPQIFDAVHAFTVAYEFESTETKSFNNGTFGVTAGVDQKNNTNSFVAEYRLSLYERLHLSASGRHDNQSIYDNFDTYRTTAAYVIPETGSRIHASYGIGFKNPTISDTSSVFGTTFLGNPNLTPEKSRTWDAGIEQAFFNERIVIDATYFQERLEDEISTNFFPPTFTTAETVNLSGISKRRGYELSLSAYITDKTEMSASYTYTDSTQDQNGTGTFTREIRRPPHISSVNLNHRFYQDRANVNIGMFHNSDDLDFGNRFIKQYTLVNLAASFDVTKYVNLHARIDNLTNQIYESPLGFFSSGFAAFAGVNISLNP